MDNSQEMLILGACQRHIHMLPDERYTEKADPMVSDLQFPRFFEMGRGGDIVYGLKMGLGCVRHENFEF